MMALGCQCAFLLTSQDDIEIVGSQSVKEV